jgi:autoinducer 2-degrading protein
MNTIIASFRIIEGKEAEAEEAMAKQAAAVEANEPGALAYVFHRHAKDPAQITVFEVYANDDAVTAHRGTEHMTAFGKLFGTIFDPGTVKIERQERVSGFVR